MQVRKAQRAAAKLRIGLQGPSGSGKTYSALLLAHGITSDWSKVVVIDTENNSADLYSHLGDYNVINIDQPFTPEKYIEAIGLAELAVVAVSNDATAESAETATAPVIIIDSISHEWEGQGGVLDIHNSMAGNSFTNWGKITPRHNALINKILQSYCHVIITIRSKQDYVLTERNGKMVPEKVGLKGVTRDGLDYELTVVFELDLKNNAVASKDRTGLFQGKPEFKINQIIGQRLKSWAGISVTPVQVKKLIESSQSLEELIGIYNEHPDVREVLRDDFQKRKAALKPNN